MWTDQKIRSCDLGESKFRSNECAGGVDGYIAFGWFRPERTESMRRIGGWTEDGVNVRSSGGLAVEH